MLQVRMSAANRHRVLIVGGGASGLIAAISARRMGARVTVLERNPRVGKKILVTGNGRCNFTHVHADVRHYHGRRPEFVRSALAAFNVPATLRFFEKLGIAHKVEDGGKVYPMSDQAASVLDVLRYELDAAGVETVCDACVVDIKQKGPEFEAHLKDGSAISGDRLILAAGGKAMPSTGSDGRGYTLAERFGHTLVAIFPALVQLKLGGGFFKQIDGVRVVGTAELRCDGQSLRTESGDLLFTNYGLSGPPVLQLSRQAGERLRQRRQPVLRIAIIPTTSEAELDAVLAKRFGVMPNKTVEFSLVGLINKRLIRVLLTEAGIRDLRSPVGSLPPEGRRKIARILTAWDLPIRDTLSWPSAQVTAGGIGTSDVSPDTLESKRVPGLYFAGEILDIDGDCGGFNLQWAWSSGHVAGQHAARPASSA